MNSLNFAEATDQVVRGLPGDDEEDYALPIWAGLIPMRKEILAPTPDARNLPELKPPTHVTGLGLGSHITGS